LTIEHLSDEHLLRLEHPMTTTTLDSRILRTAGSSWVSGPQRDRRPSAADDHRLLAAFGLAIAITISLIFVLGLLAAPGGDPASASGGEPATAAGDTPMVHVARPGDTLWSIAADHHGAADLGRYLDTLIRLNGDSAIAVGQAIRLP
jgi:hypothetical protein